MPAVRPVTLFDVTLPTLRSWNPGTKLANVFTVDTSRKYVVALADEFQRALNEVHVIVFAVFTPGAAGAAGKVIRVLTAEFPLVPQLFVALMRYQ